MEARYIGNSNSLGFEHNKVYEIRIEREKHYPTYILIAYTQDRELRINYASVISIKQNWRISDVDLDLMLKE